MLIIPAIDLKNGKVVRLRQGKAEDETIYSNSPEDVARFWQEKGAKRLHVVDLDGAFEGKPKNLEAVNAIIGAVNIPIELGGGIRTLRDIEEILNLGVEWVILGTSVILNPDLVKAAILKFQERILVGIDAQDGKVSIKGWQNQTQILAKNLVRDVERMGVRGIIYTDILHDGMMKGPNFEGITELVEATGLELIASGGISFMEDIKRLIRLKRENLIGIIIGKALYEGEIGLEEAIKIQGEGSRDEG